MKKVKISIIILSWNTKALLRQCLESLMSKLEIIVVDNGSSDGSAAMVEKEFSGVKLIKNKKNLGFAKGNNQALRRVQGDLIMLLNSDTIVKKGAIEKLAVQLIKSKRIGAVSPLLLLPDGQPQIDYYMRFPNLAQIVLYHNPVLRPLIMRTPLRRLVVTEVSRSEVKKTFFGVDQLPGAALMARREAWEKIGLLDEDYRFLYEDVDWCYRAKKKGFELVVVPEAKVTHLGGASWKKRLKENSSQFYHQFFSSLLLFVRKNYGLLQFKLFRLVIVLNFLITLKPKLALAFLKKEIKQKELWEVSGKSS